MDIDIGRSLLISTTTTTMLEESPSGQADETDQQHSPHGAYDISKKKIDRPNFNVGGLSVKTSYISNLPNGLLSLQPTHPSHEPHSATPCLKSRKLRSRFAQDYSACYERADCFLDSNGFVIVEPGAETKIRKHIKVLTRTQSLASGTQSEMSSPMVYVGSPMLQKVSDSSLLARRTLSRTQSPMLKLSSPLEENSTTAYSQTSSPTPIRLSKFSESSFKIQEKLTMHIIIEEKKTQSARADLGSPEPNLKDKGRTYDASQGNHEDSPRIDSEEEFLEEERVMFKPHLSSNEFRIEE